MKCHYEVLNVPLDADDAQIKTSYRKLALKWHPDKNLDNVEYAKAEFQLVQQAYETLSDRQERAWYDKHREQILFGSNSEYKDSNLNIFQYFTSSCFKGYDDDENGFYTVYRKAFEEIVQDEIQCMLDKDELFEVPSFGTSTSDYEEIVGPFYDYWTSYSTKKSFVWLDQYNIQDVHRRVLKMIEKEHKKTRQKAKKEWNEEVRALVAFVKKRDKRVKEYAKVREAKILENRQKNEELSKQKRKERNKLLNESHKTQAEWTKFDNVKNELEEIEKSLAEEFGEQISDHEDEDTDLEVNNLYCVACNKIFKSPKAFSNHELSKKHKENVLNLKETLMEESTEDPDDSQGNVTEDDDDLIILDDDVLSDSSVDEVIKQSKPKKKQKKRLRHESVTEDQVNAFLVKEAAEDFKFEGSKRKNRNRKNKVNNHDSEEHPSTSTNVTEQCNQDESEKIVTDDKNASKLNKKASSNKQAKENSNESQYVATNQCCVTCKTNFSSKNKLFNHLKKTGHSVHIPQETQLTKPVKNLKLDK